MRDLWMQFRSSLNCRMFLLLALGMSATFLGAFWLPGQARNSELIAQHNQQIAQQAIKLAIQLNSVSKAARLEMPEAIGWLGLNMQFGDLAPVRGESIGDLRTEINFGLGNAGKVRDVRLSPDCRVALGAESRPEPSLCTTVDLRLMDGTPLRLSFDSSLRPLAEPCTTWQLVLFLTGLLVLSAIATWLATSPLKQLAGVAQGLGQDLQHHAKEQGSRELRKGIRALNTLRNKLHQHVQQRICIFSGVIIDLQDSIAALQVRIEQPDSPQIRREIHETLQTMQLRIRSGAELAQCIGKEDLQPLMIRAESLVGDACNDGLDAGWDVMCSPLPDGVAVKGHPGLLRHCLMSLLEHAVKCGGFAHVMMYTAARQLVIEVRDAGPALSDHALATLFEPFHDRAESPYRLLPRTAGFGLTIARDIAERHGGGLQLQNGMIGVIATLTLPIHESSLLVA
ncbi:ATP-binding protein [Andreprevotia chitinilytica]|uniref:ATP-binding protein n=1 Tax=Andreprevotia chitinilytica TaxID=396808 RepID=UPI000556DC99|nr:ATP-binding protein [Andreprevotia chitinilytica]